MERRNAKCSKSMVRLDDDLGVILLIEPLINAKVGNQLVVNTHLQSDYPLNI